MPYELDKEEIKEQDLEEFEGNPKLDSPEVSDSLIYKKIADIIKDKNLDNDAIIERLKEYVEYIKRSDFVEIMRDYGFTGFREMLTRVLSVGVIASLEEKQIQTILEEIEKNQGSYHKSMIPAIVTFVLEKAENLEPNARTKRLKVIAKYLSTDFIDEHLRTHKYLSTDFIDELLRIHKFTEEEKKVLQDEKRKIAEEVSDSHEEQVTSNGGSAQDESFIDIKIIETSDEQERMNTVRELLGDLYIGGTEAQIDGTVIPEAGQTSQSETEDVKTVPLEQTSIDEAEQKRNEAVQGFNSWVSDMISDNEKTESEKADDINEYEFYSVGYSNIDKRYKEAGEWKILSRFNSVEGLLKAVRLLSPEKTYYEDLKVKLVEKLIEKYSTPGEIRKIIDPMYKIDTEILEMVQERFAQKSNGEMNREDKTGEQESKKENAPEDAVTIATEPNQEVVQEPVQSQVIIQEAEDSTAVKEEPVAEVIQNIKPTDEITEETENATTTVTEPIYEVAQTPEQIQDEQQAEESEFLDISLDENTASAVNESIRKNAQVQELLQQEEILATENVQEGSEQETEPKPSEEENLEYLEKHFLELGSSDIKKILLELKSKEKFNYGYKMFASGLIEEDKEEVEKRKEELENEGKRKSDNDEQETEPKPSEEENLEYLEKYCLVLGSSDIKKILLELKSKEKLNYGYEMYADGLIEEDKKEVKEKIRQLEIEEIKAKRKKFMLLKALLPKWLQKDRE